MSFAVLLASRGLLKGFRLHSAKKDYGEWLIEPYGRAALGIRTPDFAFLRPVQRAGNKGQFIGKKSAPVPLHDNGVACRNLAAYEHVQIEYLVGQTPLYCRF